MCAGTESSGVWITAWWIICPCVFSVSAVNETHGTWQQALNPTLSDGCVCSLRSPSLVRGEPLVLRLPQLSGKTRRTLAVSSVHRGVNASGFFTCKTIFFLSSVSSSFLGGMLWSCKPEPQVSSSDTRFAPSPNASGRSYSAFTQSISLAYSLWEQCRQGLLCSNVVLLWHLSPEGTSNPVTDLNKGNGSKASIPLILGSQGEQKSLLPILQGLQRVQPSKHL